MQQKFCKCLIAAILSFNNGWGQELSPPIQNFSSVEYNAASQNWDIGIDSLGIIYAANSEGLLSYDGQQWEKHRLRSGSMIRSVFPFKNRVYTGSYKEFGFWVRNKMGRLEYNSLSDKLQDYEMGNEEVWEILEFQGAIYFRSFAAIYKLDNNTVIPILNRVNNAIEVYNGELLVSYGNQGVFTLKDNGDLIPLEGSEILKGKTVIEIEGDGKQLLLGTRDALYSCMDSSCRLFSDNELNDMLEKFELNHILRISENELVFATVKNGIIHYSRNSQKIKVYNRNSGLQNNTVLGMIENQGKLWVSLDNGIDVLDLNAPINFFTDDTGELGAVYDLVHFQDDTYLASNTGVYASSAEGFKLVKGAEGHSWNLEVINGNMYSNHNAGTYQVRAGKFIPIEERTGSFCIVPKPGENNILYIGNYTGLSVYYPGERKLFEIPGVNFPVKKIVFEDNGVIWASHPYEGVYRIKPAAKNEGDFLVEKIGSNNGENNYKADLFKINNRIAIFRNNSWYKFNEFEDSLVPFEELQDYKHHRLLLEDGDKYWFVNNLNSSIVYTDFKKLKVSLALDELNKRLVKGYEKLIKDEDSVYYLTLNDGFGKIDLKELLKSRNNGITYKPLILGFEDSHEEYDLSKTPVVPFQNAGQIKIKIGYTSSDGSDLFYVLEGNGGKQKSRVSNGNINFQNLSSGNYNLEVFALNAQQVASRVAVFDFTIRPPWYLSKAMKLLYILLSLGLFLMVYMLNKKKLRKHQLLIEQKFKKEHEERLYRLEKENLLNEINNKRKELANTTMIGAKKNEILLDIQGELSKDKNNFSNQFRLRHLMNKINGAIKNKDEWKLFETNFNELHEDFFKELLVAYPNLSNRDLKLCSYLKMNLSSKEIAPLMGITVRGVEVHRYRLRKKMNLDNKENLTSFLIKEF